MEDGNVCIQEAVGTYKLESNKHDRSDNHATDNKYDYNLKTDDRFPPGEIHWEYILIYVDNLMVALRHTRSVMEEISYVYTLKEKKKTNQCFGPPDMYLETKTHKFKDKDADDDQYCWSMSVENYVKSIVDNVEDKILNHVRQLNAKQQSLFTTGYRPEMNTSP